MSVERDLAFILGQRPLSDSKVILQFLSQNNGVFSAVYRVAKKAVVRQLPMFGLANIEWAGKSDLKTAYRCEIDSRPCHLEGKSLFCGFYLKPVFLCCP